MNTMPRDASQGGQSIIEYLVMAVVIITVMLSFQGAMKTATSKLMDTTRSEMASVPANSNVTADHLFTYYNTFK